MQLCLIDVSHAAIIVFLLLAMNHTGCWPESTLLLRTRWHIFICLLSSCWKWKLQVQESVQLNVRMCSGQSSATVIMFGHVLARRNAYSNARKWMHALYGIYVAFCTRI